MVVKKNDIKTLVRRMSASAVEVARDFKIELDFTDASVKKVERILGELHRHYKKTKDDDGLNGLALFFAAYLGDVIQRKGLGGKWKRHHPQWGKNSFPFSWQGGELFLFGWCQKRIYDGKQDDVWLKYRAIVLGK